MGLEINKIINLFKKKKIEKYYFDYKYQLRNNQTDIQTAVDVFEHKYHRPDIELLCEKPIILDLGSNIGLSIIDLKILYPQSTIIGVEMDLDNFNLAMLNCVNLQDVKLYNNAIWVNDDYLIYDKSSAYDAYNINPLNVKFENPKQIKGITISTLIELNNIEIINYLKMDIEGAEDFIFQDNLDWLSKVNYIKIEVHNGDESMRLISNILSNGGFRVRKDTLHWSTLIGEKIK